MNGRIYDFNVGRFLSVDPLLQFPENSQSANPYSYILNNPMAGTDPTGYACAGSNLESVCDSYFKDNKIVTENMKLTDAISNTLNNGKATASNGQANELQMAQTGGAAKQEKKAVGLQLNTDKQSLSYGNDPSFIKGYDSVEGDMSGILSMTGPALAVDAVKAGIETANEIADEYEQSGLSMSTFIVAGKAAGEAAIDVGAKKFRLPGVAKRGPKTDPNAPHNKKIREIGDQIEADGGTVIAGGGRLPEQLVRTPGGNKSGRRPDVLYQDCKGNLCGVNVGKTKADGSPVKREQQALDDLNGAGLPTRFERYN
ncbi:RHS repeat domain-containing protein [Shewanella glacialipiscicola]|uniref:RHS repeat domain-containing protein n=1 Tax=Shewanella glacialipiscicola TaxID=614069 RepID=UPI003D7B8A2B